MEYFTSLPILSHAGNGGKSGVGAKRAKSLCTRVKKSATESDWRWPLWAIDLKGKPAVHSSRAKRSQFPVMRREGASGAHASHSGMPPPDNLLQEKNAIARHL